MKRVQDIRIARCVGYGARCLLLGAMLCVQGTAQAQLDRRGLMADAVLASPHAGLLLDERRLTEAVLDPRARVLFRQLRPDPQWGPAHPAWKANFTEFKRELQQMTPVDESRLKAQMKTALLRDLSEAELAEIDQAMADPALGESIKVAADAGLDPSFAFRIAAMGNQPDLYGPEEVDEVRRVITRLQQKETELMASERTRSAVARLDTPAFRKYQQTMIGVVEAQVSGGAADTARRAAVDDMLVRWRARIGN
ncbi:MAG: hypothetical protein IPL03_15905 [Sterolibacteriaceae bacterium]|nr:hypothetical protein [Candidatus Methylophosphatis haderslevensis]